MKKIAISLVVIGSFILSGCSTTPAKEYADLQLPSNNNSSAFSLNLRSALKHINQGNFSKAAETLDNLKNSANTTNEQTELILTQAILMHGENQTPSAIDLLVSPKHQALFSEADIILQKQINEYLAKLYSQSGLYIKAAKQLDINSENCTDSQSSLQNNQAALWNNLKKAPVEKLKNSSLHEADKQFKEWLRLSYLVLGSHSNFQQQIASINQWQHNNPTHPAAMIPPKEVIELKLAYNNIPQRIAVILPFEGRYKNASNAIRDGIMENFFNQKKSNIRFYNADPSLSFLPVYEEAVLNGADLIIGPLLKEHLKELSTQRNLPVKTIALNELKNTPLPENLIQFSLASEDEVDSLIDYANLNHHQRALVITDSSDWAKNNTNYFTNQWLNQGHAIVDSAAFTSTQSQSKVVRELLNIDNSHRRSREVKQTINENIENEPRRRQDIDMIVLFARPDQALAIPPLFNFYFASDLPIYTTSSIFKGYDEKQSNTDLNGVKITEFPLVVDKPASIPRKYQRSTLIRMFAFGKDAFALSEKLPALSSNDGINIYGATGVLSFTDNKIRRRTKPAVFKGGIIQASTTTTRKI